MQYLATQIKNYFLAQEEGKRKERNSFWPSEAEKMGFEIYHSWIGTPETNPIEPEKLVMFKAAKLMELALIGALKKACKVLEPPTGDQWRVNMEREGIKVTGYMDGVLLEEVEPGTEKEGEQYYDEFGKSL